MKKLLPTLAFLILSSFCAAQSGKSHILSGNIVDSNSLTPLSLATIKLFSIDQKKLIKETSSGIKGEFAINVFFSADIICKISLIGYESKNIKIKTNDGDLNLGKINLVKSYTSLKAVDIIVKRQIIKQEADRIIYDLQADPDSKTFSILEMMRKIPFLSLDGERKLLLRGKSDYKIFFNGRPSGLFVNNPEQILQTMPASTIQKIEVITNPPAKYDAEGLAGIINIITVKKIVDGYQGSLTLNENFIIGGPSVGSNFTVKRNKVNANIILGGAYSYSPETNLLDQRSSAISLLTQNSSQTSNTINGYFGSEISYEVDSIHLLTIQLNSSNHRSNSFLIQKSSLLNNLANQEYILNKENRQNRPALDGSLNYQISSKTNKTRFFTFSLQHSETQGLGKISTNYLQQLNITNGDLFQSNNRNTNENSAQFDFSQKIKKVLVEAGVKGINRHLTSNYLDSATRNNPMIFTPLNQTDVFSERQSILALYNSYRFPLKTWNFTAGLRMEETFNKISASALGSDIEQDYLNLVPTVSIGHSFSTNNISFGYAERIKRPGIGLLNPFQDQTNPYQSTGGNPFLKPTIVHVFQAGYSSSKKLYFNASMAYTNTKQLPLSVITFNVDSNVSHTTYQNIGHAQGVNFNVNFSYPFTKKLNVEFNGSADYTSLKSQIGNNLYNNSVFASNMFLSSSYGFQSGLRLFGNFQYVGTNLTSLQSRSGAVTNLTIGFSQSFFNKKLSISGDISDFYRRKRQVETFINDPAFEERITQTQPVRNFRISINYKFGKLKTNVKKTRKVIRNDDVSNS